MASILQVGGLVRFTLQCRHVRHYGGNSPRIDYQGYVPYIWQERNRPIRSFCMDGGLKPVRKEDFVFGAD